MTVHAVMLGFVCCSCVHAAHVCVRWCGTRVCAVLMYNHEKIPNQVTALQVGNYKFATCENEEHYRDNVDFEGSDLVKGGYQTAGSKECCGKCAANPSCHFWTYSKSKKKCWIKSSQQGQEQQSDRKSGYKPNTVTKGNIQFSPCEVSMQSGPLTARPAFQVPSLWA